MAWVRRVRTGSGATAVQIAESVGGRRRIVRHVGSARDEATLGLLMQQARDLLEDDMQGVLDLGMQVPQRAARLVPAPTEPVLFGGQPGPPRRGVAPARVMRTCSRLLYDTLAAVFDGFGFGVVGDDCFRDLVIARIVEPTSLLDVDRVLAELGRTSASLSTRKRTLRRAQSGAYRDRIAEACFAHACTHGDVSLVLYDVTTLYFEADKEDELRKVGYSKERRVDPQIVVGLLVDRNGFPLEIGCFEGNKAETATIIPIVKQFQDRHNLADMVVVADAGMLSAANLRELDQAKQGVITNPNMAVAGEIGAGKSALLKSLVTRSLCFGRRAYVPGDPKGEWTPVTRAVGGTVIELGPGMPARINPLDAGTRPTELADGEWRRDVRTRRLSSVVSSSRSPPRSSTCSGGPGRLAVPTRPLFVRAAPAHTGVSRHRLPSASPACCDSPGRSPLTSVR